MTVLGKVRLGAFALALWAALSAVPRAVRAQETPPPTGNDAPAVTPAPAPRSDAPPAPPTAQPSSPPPAQPGYPPSGQPGYPPPGQPSYPPSGQESYAPPGQGYPPGYAPPGYAPGYAPPGYPPGYAPPGYPPGYAPPRYAPTEPTHSGLYLHLHLGGGFTSVTGSGGYSGTLKYSGGGPSFAVAVGGAVAPNLALFGNLFFTGSSDLKVSGGGYTTDSSGDTLLAGIGGGIVYYFMPVNIFISAALVSVQFEADDANGKTIHESDFGVGFQGMIGKEFWVSEHWGLGAALEFVGAGSMKDKDDPNMSWSGGAFNVLFSATCF
jgi:hypothetical protein